IIRSNRNRSSSLIADFRSAEHRRCHQSRSMLFLRNTESKGFVVSKSSGSSKGNRRSARLVHHTFRLSGTVTDSNHVIQVFQEAFTILSSDMLPEINRRVGQ